MRAMPTRVHGMIDDATGFLLIVAPYLSGFHNGGVAQHLPMHPGIGVAGGALLAVSPRLFGFAEIGVGPMTRSTPDTGHVTTGRI